MYISELSSINLSKIKSFNKISFPSFKGSLDTKTTTNTINLEKQDEEKHKKFMQYLDTYKYFMGLKLPTGEKMFSSRKDRTSDDGIALYLFDIDSSSVEASNFSMLVELVQKGVIGKHIFEYLPLSGKVNSSVSKDIDRLYEAYSLGIEPIEAFVPTFNSLSEAMENQDNLMKYKGTYKELNVGDVFQVKGEKYIRIKTSYNSSRKLELTKEKYFELFPPIERYASTQNEIANCWEISAINSILCEPKARYLILQMFRQEGNDVVVNFPCGFYKDIRFINSKLPDKADKKYYSQGAMGVKMLEYAEGVDTQFYKILKIYKRLQDEIKSETDLRKKQEKENILNSFIHTFCIYDMNVSIDTNHPENTKGYNGEFDNAFSENRNHGWGELFYARLGLNDTRTLGYSFESHKDKISAILNNPDFFKNHLVCWSSRDLTSENTPDFLKGIDSLHMYRIIPAKTDKNGTIETFNIVNPWGIMENEFTIDELNKYGGTLTTARIPDVL